MAGREFIVLYTHQKRKKAKVWQDGVLKINDQGTKAVLIGEGNKRLDQLHIKANQAAIGEELESEKYLITIEENVSSDKPIPEGINLEKRQTNQPDQRPPTQAPRKQTLKRKRTGFVPPRQVSKKPSPEKENYPKTQCQQSSTSSGLGSPRSSLFSTPSSETKISSLHGPDILNMYGRNTVQSSHGNAVHTPSKLQVRDRTRSDPHGMERHLSSESQELSDDYIGILSRHHAATGCLEHPQNRAVTGKEQFGSRPGKSTEMKGMWDGLEGGAGISRMDLQDTKSSLFSAPASSSHKLRGESTEWDTNSEQTYQTAISVKQGLNPDAVEPMPTEEDSDNMGVASGAKRSTSRILALLGKGKKPFHPPLKQKSTEGMISHSSTGLTENSRFQYIPRSHKPVHAHQNNCQASIISSEPIVADHPAPCNMDLQESDISPTGTCTSRMFGHTERSAASNRASPHCSIPSENDVTRVNTNRDQVMTGESPREVAVCEDTSAFSESLIPRLNQFMKHGVDNRTGFEKDKGSQRHETDPQCESKNAKCTPKLGSTQEVQSLNIMGCETDSKVVKTCRFTADVKEVADCPSEWVVEQSLIHHTKEEGNSENRMITDVYDSEGSVLPSTCVTNCNNDPTVGEVELNIVLKRDNHDIKSNTSTEEKSALLETEISSDPPPHSGSHSSRHDEANESVCHQSFDCSQEIQATPQNMQQVNLTDDICEDLQSATLKACCQQISFNLVDDFSDSSLEQDGYENKIDVTQRFPNVGALAVQGEAEKRCEKDGAHHIKPSDDFNPYTRCMHSSSGHGDIKMINVVQSTPSLDTSSDVHKADDKDKPESDDAQLLMHSVDSDTDDSHADSSCRHASFKNMTYVVQESPRLKAVSEQDDDGDKLEKDDPQHIMHSVDSETDNSFADSTCSFRHADLKNATSVVQISTSLKEVSGPGGDGGKLERNGSQHVMLPDGIYDAGRGDAEKISLTKGAHQDPIVSPINVNSGEMSSVASHPEQDGFKDASSMFCRSPSLEAGTCLEGDNLLKNRAQKSLHPVTTSVHSSQTCDVELIIPDSNSQQSSVTSIDTLNFSHNTQEKEDPSLYFQDVMTQEGHYLQRNNDHSSLLSQDVEAVVPDMKYTETHYPLASLCGRIIDDLLAKKTSSSSAPTCMSVMQESEQSVPEIPSQHEIVTARKHEECGEVCTAEEVSGERFLSGQCSTIFQKPELSAQASGCSEKEVNGNIDCNSHTCMSSSNQDHHYFRTTHDKPGYLQAPLSGNVIKDQSSNGIAYSENSPNFSESLRSPVSLSSKQAYGSTPFSQKLEAYDMQERMGCSLNATQNRSRMQPQLRSPSSLSGAGSQQETWSPVFQLPHPEQLYGSTFVQSDGGDNVCERFEDEQTCSPASVILPHPSYLKTSVRRNASSKSSHVVSKDQEEFPKRGIYWKQFKSSGTVRRCSLSPFQTAFQSRQNQNTPLEIETSGIHLQDICSGSSGGPFSLLDHSIYRHPQTPIQTPSRPRHDVDTSMQMLPSHTDRIPAFGTSASRIIRSTPSLGNPFSPSQNTAVLSPLLEPCNTSTTEGQGIHPPNILITDIRDNQDIPESEFLEDGPSCNTTSMQNWDTVKHHTHLPLGLDYGESQTGHNTHPFTLEERLHDVFRMSQARRKRLCSPLVPNSHQASDFFTLSDSERCLTQGSEQCRDQQLSPLLNLKSLQCVSKVNNLPSPEQDVMTFYPRREEERYHSGCLYQQESPLNIQTLGEDVMSAVQHFDSQPCDHEETGSDEYEVSNSASRKQASEGGMTGPLEVKHPIYDCSALNDSLYVHCSKGTDFTSRSLSMSSGDVLQCESDRQISNSASIGNMALHEVLCSRFTTQQHSGYQKHDNLDACDNREIDQNVEQDKVQSQPCISSCGEGRQCPSRITADDLYASERHELGVHLERAHTPDLFSTQQDDLLSVCSSPGESCQGHARSPESISLPETCSLDQPDKQMDAGSKETDSILRGSTDTQSGHDTSTYMYKTSHSGERKQIFRHRPLISKPTNDPNTPLPKIFHKGDVEENCVPSVTDSLSSDRQIHTFDTKTSGKLDIHVEDFLSQVDMSVSDVRDHGSVTIMEFESCDECFSLSPQQDGRLRQDSDQVMCSRSVSSEKHPTSGSFAVIGKCEQSYMNQLHQEYDDCSHITHATNPSHQLTKFGSKQHHGTPSENELLVDLDLVEGERQKLMQEMDECGSEDNTAGGDDALYIGIQDKQVTCISQEDDAVHEVPLVTRESLHSTRNNVLPNNNYEPSFRVGTFQEELGVGQIDIQGIAASLQHSYHMQQHTIQSKIGKTRFQTQWGDALTRGIVGRQRSEMKKGFRTPVSQISNIGVRGELNFPAADTVHSGVAPQRKIAIPVSFPNVSSYKHIMTEAVKEHLNIVFHELSHRYHSTMEKADITSYTSTHHGTGTSQMSGGGGGHPQCKHGQPAKMVCVKKDGPNKGRMFYVCSNQQEKQCKFFVWADQLGTQSSQVQTQPSQSRAKIPLHNAESIEKFARTNQVRLYCESQLSRRCSLNDGLLGSAPAWVKKYRAQQANNTTKKLYIKLDRKEHSSTYAKDDLWIISQDLTFDPLRSFVARSMFHGPSSSNEIEIEPLTGYSPSNWSAEGAVYGILACNATSELTCLDNLQEYVNSRTFPILPHLISCEFERNPSLHGPAFVKPSRSHLTLPPSLITELVEDTIRSYHLNPDQSSALQQVASMVGGQHPPLTLIHGVFGAGKSYLLAVMVLLLVQLFKLSKERETGGHQGNDWKVLIASTTNVAVDRILLGLLDMGFEDFIRVGSLRKIAKPVLPYSVHASDKENQEMKELQEMLKGDLTLSEKQLVRRSIERQRLGKNKEMLAKVRVVGVTCAACSFPCIKNLTFPVVLLDECSQMTEPSSLLPMARFGCEKLVLVGDPHQLDPTIQGSESAHKAGLEQTLFDRLSCMGYDPIMLRTQYRCHPCISSLANTLFYDGQLLDGVMEEDRPPLLPDLPPLCFFNIPHGREMSARDGSYFNEPEASFVVFLISSMMKMGIPPADVGVITLYKAQVSRIRMLLQTSTENSSELKAIQISTVDAFQGGEKSIIILSCVRTQRVGFIDSDKRTNVALTRSKNHLLIVGGMKMLSDNQLWGEIIHKCQERPDGVQDSKAFQKHWEERLGDLEQDGDLEREKPKRKRGEKRKLAKIEREHSPAMSLDSNDGDFVISASRSLSGTTDDCIPVISETAGSKDTSLHLTGSPHSPAADEDDLPYVDLCALDEDREAMSDARSPTDHLDVPHSQEVVSLTAAVTLQADDSPCPSHSSTDGDDLPHVDLGVLPKDGNDQLDLGLEESVHSQEVASPSERREPTVTPETSFSYSPLQDVVESDSDNSAEDLPNFDIGSILL